MDGEVVPFGFARSPSVMVPPVPSEMATRSHFATPRDGEVPFGPARSPIALPRPTTLETGDSLRSPPTARVPPTAFKSGTLRSHPRMARS
eukprot:9171833-Pyramimonas_sp.AAC.1